MKYLKYFICASSVLFATTAACEGKDYLCPEGKLAFYGKMIHTGSVEKLCLTGDRKGIFYTKTADNDSYVSFNTLDVVRNESIGEEGSTIGYRFTLSGSDTISFKAFFQNGLPAPVMGFLDVNDNVTEINPDTIKIQ